VRLLADPPVLDGRPLTERQKDEAPPDPRKAAEVPGTVSAVEGPEVEFPERNGRRTNPAACLLELPLFFDRGGDTVQEGDQVVGVEQVRRHQSACRTS